MYEESAQEYLLNCFSVIIIMSLLMNVPSDVSLDILSLWLKYAEYVRLDSAFCHHKYRSVYLNLLSKTMFYDDNKSERFSYWLISKNIQPHSLLLKDHMTIKKNGQPRFLESVWLDVKSLKVDFINKKFYAVIASQSWSNLTSLSFSRFDRLYHQRRDPGMLHELRCDLLHRLTSLSIKHARMEELSLIKDNCRGLDLNHTMTVSRKKRYCVRL